MVDTWAALSSAVATADMPTTIELINNISLPGGAANNAITIPAGHEITLTGGYTITRTAAGQRHFIVNGTLILENITISGSSPAVTGNHGGISVNAGGSLYMEAGSTIRNNRQSAAAQAAGVNVSGAGASFVMNGGVISGNATTIAGGVGGVFVENSAVFIMNNGIINGNSGRLGGGVRIGTGAALPAYTATRFYMNGGEIYGNTGSLGGGINVEHGSFIMESGTIHGNTATGLDNAGTTLANNRGGGGVFIQNGGRFDMGGGSIYNNRSYQRGGGVHMLAGTTFAMTGGLIDSNTANRDVSNPNVLGITHNTGGGVAVQGGEFNMSGGSVTRNTANSDGGGIWVDLGTPTTGARLDMTVGTVSYNTATTGDGGGVFANPTSTIDPLPANAYQNIVSAIGNFTGNTAGGGRFAPPSNAYTRHFGHLLNNYDINFRGPNQLVIFNLNGGSVGGGKDDIVLSLPISSEIGDSNVPAPERENHSLTGWRLDGAGSILSPEDVAGMQVDGNMLFIAVWGLNVHEVTFYLQGGMGTFPMQMVTHGSYATEPLSEPTPAEGAGAFIGWFAHPYSGNYGPFDFAATPILSNTSIYARWSSPILPSPMPTPTPPPGQSPEPEPEPGSGPARPSPTPRPFEAPPSEPFTRPMPQPRGGFRERFMIGFPNGYFVPNGFLTRAEAAALLVRTMTTSFGVDVPRAQVDSSRFSDVLPGAWYAEYIAIAYSYGLILGFPDGSFRPNSPITREQFAAMLTRAAAIQTNGSLPYTDAASVSNWAYNYVYSVLYSGFMHGDAIGTFRPHDKITRAEAAAAMCRILGRADTSTSNFYGVPNVIIFPDAANENAWYYYYIVEATNSYWYIGEGEERIWTEVRSYRQ